MGCFKGLQLDWEYWPHLIQSGSSLFLYLSTSILHTHQHLLALSFWFLLDLCQARLIWPFIALHLNCPISHCWPILTPCYAFSKYYCTNLALIYPIFIIPVYTSNETIQSDPSDCHPNCHQVDNDIYTQDKINHWSSIMVILFCNCWFLQTTNLSPFDQADNTMSCRPLSVYVWRLLSFFMFATQTCHFVYKSQRPGIMNWSTCLKCRHCDWLVIYWPQLSVPSGFVSSFRLLQHPASWH